MKRVVAALWAGSMAANLVWHAGLFAQGQIPNGAFEAWTTPPLATYEEPSGGWWTTLNTLKSIGGPETVEKTTDAHSGSYAAVLTTKQWGTLTIPGLLVSGVFDIQNPSFLVQGQPYTDKPDAFKGWFKYSPVGGDSAGIAALLTRWNTTTQQRDTLAQAAWVVTSPYTNWTEFNLPFVYFQPGQAPDSILVALVSSQEGQNFNGQVGSTLWVDDISLEFGTAADDAPSLLKPSVHWFEGHWSVVLPQAESGGELRVYDLNGRLLQAHALRSGAQEIPFSALNGVYLAEVRKGNRVVLRRKIAFLHP